MGSLDKIDVDSLDVFCLNLGYFTIIKDATKSVLRSFDVSGGLVSR